MQQEEKPALDEVQRDRLYDIKQVKEEEKQERENIKISKENREEVMKKKEVIEEEKDNLIKNKNLGDLISGFLSTKDREKYISINADNFKNLPPQEQQTLYKVYYKYL